MTRRTIVRGMAGSAMLAPLVACGGSARPTATVAPAAATGAAVSGRQIAVAATTMQIQDFVKNIGGDRVTIYGVLKPNVDPHDYEPTVNDANAIARADVIFVHGIGLDAWMTKAIKTANSAAPVVTATDGIKPLKGDQNDSEGDPHVWFDPTLVQTMVTNIATALMKRDPAGANVYQQNAKSYSAQVEQMDGQVQGIYSQLPLAQRKLVTNHDVFRYLANRYGLTVVGAVIPSLSDTAEPTAKQINDLIDTIRRERVRAIFAESSANPKVAQQVAKETDITIVDTLYGDTLGEPGSAGDTYIKMMAYNATTIVNALK